MNAIVVAILLAVNMEVGLAVSRLTQPRQLRDNNLSESISLVQLLGLLSDDTQSLHQEKTPEVMLVQNIDEPDSEEGTDFSFITKLLRRPQPIPQSKIPEDVRNLYYAETDASGKETYAKWLYNLRDVAVLLKEKFNVDIAM